ncbi:MAG: hypothetical protein AMK71_09835 [Nitrospira bacterium SG8_35_4]|nr:MAG: hypothetical protein AMK71_09835 [Nitrospira bacterium SG8_35_4]
MCQEGASLRRLLNHMNYSVNALNTVRPEERIDLRWEKDSCFKKVPLPQEMAPAFSLCSP